MALGKGNNHIPNNRQLFAHLGIHRRIKGGREDNSPSYVSPFDNSPLPDMQI